MQNASFRLYDARTTILKDPRTYIERMRDIRLGSASATRLRDGANAGTFASPLIPTRDAKIRTYSSLCKISILNCSKKHKKPSVNACLF